MPQFRFTERGFSTFYVQILALVAAFSAFGILFGTWQVLVSDLTSDLQLSPGQVGVSISWGLVGSVPAMFLANRTIRRVGLRTVLLGSSLTISLMLASLSVVQSYISLFMALFLMFGMAGVYDMTINACAITLESLSRKKFLIYLHAVFSGAAALSAVGMGLLLDAGISYKALFSYGALVVGGLALTATILMGHIDSSHIRERKRLKVSGNAWTSTMLVIVTIAAIANLAQGAVENWSAIYLRNSLTYTALVGSSGVAIFHAAMLLGRVSTGMAIRQLNVSKILMVSGGVTIMGITLTLLNISSFLTLIGILLMGVSLATVQPIAFTLAGANAPNRASEASTVVTTTSYIGLLIGPVLIGVVAELTSLRIALSSVGVIGILIIVLGQRLGSTKDVNQVSSETSCCKPDTR